MAIWDKLKLKKKRIEEPQKVEAAAAEKQPEKPTPKGNTGRAYQILLRPVTSEKGTHLAGMGRYVFAVADSANKSEIRKSIERVYNVHVEAVRIISMPSKSRRYGKTKGRTSPWKKAIVEVRKGENIPGIIESVG